MPGTSGYYTYFLSSLPMLHFGMKPPFSYEQFLEKCDGIIEKGAIEILREVKDVSADTSHGQPTLKKWRSFEISLRNELVKIRAARKHQDPAGYLHENENEDVSAKRLAMNAYKSPSIIEAEKILDTQRWQALGELSVGHFFDIDSLIIYAFRLLILEKWYKIQQADKKELVTRHCEDEHSEAEAISKQ